LFERLQIDGKLDKSRSHHLLGLSHSGNIELQRLKRFHVIASCDTSAAYKNAVAGHRLRMAVPYQKPEMRMDFDAALDNAIAQLTVQNAACLDRCAG